MTDIKYILTKGEERIECDSMVEVSNVLEVTVFRVRNALDRIGDIDGWSLQREFVKRDDRYVGVAPDGRAVKFRSSTEAARLLETLASPIVKAADRKGAHGNWRFFHTSEYQGNEFVPFTPEVKATFAIKQRNKPKPGEDDETEDPRTPIAKGYFVSGIDPCICPICKKVVSNFKGDGERHLLRCLRGHEYKIRYGIVKVYD